MAKFYIKSAERAAFHSASASSSTTAAAALVAASDSVDLLQL
jgi:hypothetical protein